MDSLTLTYVFTTIAGCTDSANMEITLVEAEVAEAGEPDTLCRNDDILSLEGFSPANGIWEGQGIVAGTNQFNPLLAEPGENVVTYTIGSEECETQDTKIVFIRDTASVSAGDNFIVCEGEGIATLESNVAGGIWEGPGIVDPIEGTFDTDSIQSGDDVVFTYSLTTPEGCSSSAVQVVQKSALPEVDFSQDSSVCINTEVTFENNSPGDATYQWDFGDSTTTTDPSPTHIYTQAGSYTIRLTVEATATGCSDSLTNIIQVVDVPSASFALDKTEGCAIKLNDNLSALPVTITDQSAANGGEYIWEFGTGEQLEIANPGEILFPQGPNDTTYAVRLTIDNGCDVSTLVDSVTVFPLPQVRIGLPQDDGCSPFRVDSIFNLSQGNPETYFWDLGNGNTSTELEPPFQVYRTGDRDSIYFITLLSSNNCGTDTGQIQLVVHPQNVFAGFAVDTVKGCQPLEVAFEDFSGAPFTIWDFGDGTQGDSAKNPIHTYEQAGTFEVEFIAHNQCSYDTTTRSITVLPNAPSDALVNTPVCLNDTMTFLATRSDGISGYQWDFGDGNADASPNVSHIYDTPGTFTVTLTTLSDTFLCPSTWDTTVKVSALPRISMNIPEDQGCQPFTAIFDNQSEGQFYRWDFGDGGSADEYAPNYLYNTVGNYTVEFSTEDRQGCRSDTSFIIRVFETPVSEFSIVDNSLCEGESAIFENKSIGSGLNFLWSMGNGDSLRTANPIYQYTESGTFPISLTASNAFGCEDVSTSELTVYLQPRADFEIPPLLCTDKAVSFQVLDSTATDWFWDFGDGGTANTINPVHIYDAPGIYTIRHIADYQSFCFDTVFKELELLQSPEVDFVFEFNETPDGTVFFEDASPLPGDTFQWDFGDNASGNDPNLSHQYSYADSFSVTLVSSFESGCTDTITKVLVPRYGDIQIPNAFAPTGGSSAGDARFFKPKVAGLKAFHIVIYGQWGNKVWESEDELNEVTGELLADAYWDGTDEKGKLIRSNAFIWKIHKALFIDGREYTGEKVGVLHLIR